VREWHDIVGSSDFSGERPVKQLLQLLVQATPESTLDLELNMGKRIGAG
jgi:hypothetical protein